MQSKLPDINSAIVRHRNAALLAFEKGLFEVAAISLNSINALLPEDFRVEINTKKYEQLKQEKKIITCMFCKEEYSRDTIEVFELIHNAMELMIYAQKSKMVWHCSKCNAIQNLSNSSLKVQKYQNPTFFKVVPEMPRRTDGISDRLGHQNKLKQWYSTYLEELECQIGIYRAEYMAQQDDTTDIIGDD
tara:strand:+ start:437 stop:1003 length:567 start_codon:yes stop_codon:yes gene_type:complete